MLRKLKKKSANIKKMVKAEGAQCKQLAEDDLKFVFQKRQERWRKCVTIQGGNFEKGHFDLN